MEKKGKKEEKEYLSTKEARALFGISRQTLDRRAKDGIINKYKFSEGGKSVFWKKSELRELFIRTL
ncbi:MAG: helix-turn-helix domain-containing protein [Brumimicrobium sp.]|nr:helix-turn-helix domain-containing protein [Brumimicrobium sp.]